MRGTGSWEIRAGEASDRHLQLLVHLRISTKVSETGERERRTQILNKIMTAVKTDRTGFIGIFSSSD